MATGPKRPSKKKDGGRQTRSVLATTLSSSCLAVSAVTVPTPVPQNLVSFTDYPVSNVLEKLLIDKTTGRRLTMGGDQGTAVEITPALLSRKPSPVLPRVEKSRETQGARTKKNAEVFTPSWLCAKMNDFLDGEILAAKNAKDAKFWQGYVDTRILEITCGEAPFIVSRYDAATGKLIPVKERIGLLDRKLQVVNENAADEEEWMKWAVRAYESVYGYEYQGDSLAIARANLLMTFAENLAARWGRKATTHELTAIANRIVWNFWQMDGLTGMVSVWKTIEVQHLPGFDPPKPPEQMEFFSEPKEEKKGTPLRQEKACVIFDWRARRPVTYNEIGRTCVLAAKNAKDAKTGRAGSHLPVEDNGRARSPSAPQESKGTTTMKFDYAIGNPPYQEETIGDNKTYAPPVYHKFMDETYKVADKVELITPGRFLFDAGSTPKSWNQKMLGDSHLKVLEYHADAKKVFPTIIDLTGGVVITYHDAEKEWHPIEVFTQYQELNAILQKVENAKDFQSIMDIVLSRTVYRLTEQLHQDFPNAASQLSDGHMFDMASNIFSRLPNIFLAEVPEGEDLTEYVKVLGRIDGDRVYRYVKREYVNGVKNLDTYKVVLARADGAAGTIGKPIPARVLGSLQLEVPHVGLTESFLSIGAFKSKIEARNALKYCKTRFTRILVGILKNTQDITPQKWRYVPLQDFTSASDIDWSGTVEEIDKQLYKKYKLTKKEIAFIEEKVKAME